MGIIRSIKFSDDLLIRKLLKILIVTFEICVISVWRQSEAAAGEDIALDRHGASGRRMGGARRVPRQKRPLSRYVSSPGPSWWNQFKVGINPAYVGTFTLSLRQVPTGNLH